ncbi:hypothetical protein [Echinimonas agarilytica]|uniref:Pullulanase n=1 Tax=Echinimonas agarilytica TaxID=1215918 RepID=A0AA41W6W5_9GAMM|nr:hypothetical protein [Echinimonas agarilytica]MCM2679879.1 hypothetical protein [Echinimonas agarilytica]
MFKALIIASVAAATLVTGCASTDNSAPRELSDYMFVRGDFNGWNAVPEHKLTKTSTDRLYMTSIDVTADGSVYGFKFADQLWGAGANCGYQNKEDETIVLGKRVPVSCSSSYSNFVFTPAESGTYNFYMDGSVEPFQIYVEKAE